MIWKAIIKLIRRKILIISLSKRRATASGWKTASVQARITDTQRSGHAEACKHLRVRSCPANHGKPLHLELRLEIPSWLLLLDGFGKAIYSFPRLSFLTDKVLEKQVSLHRFIRGKNTVWEPSVHISYYFSKSLQIKGLSLNLLSQFSGADSSRVSSEMESSAIWSPTKCTREEALRHSYWLDAHGPSLLTSLTLNSVPQLPKATGPSHG